MKEVHKRVKKGPDDPVPQEAIDQFDAFRTALNELNPANSGFVIGLFKDESTEKVTGLMIGSPPDLLIALTELAGQAFIGDERVQKLFLALLISKFASIQGHPGPDPYNLDDIPLDLSRFTKE